MLLPMEVRHVFVVLQRGEFDLAAVLEAPPVLLVLLEEAFRVHHAMGVISSPCQVEDLSQGFQLGLDTDGRSGRFCEVRPSNSSSMKRATWAAADHPILSSAR